MRLTVFDLDHTLLTTNSSFRFGSFLFQQKFFSFWALLGCLSAYARYKWLRMSIHDLHQKTFIHLFKGRSLADIHSHVNRFLDDVLDAMLYPPAIQRLKEAQARGDTVIILSSSPDFIVGAIAKRLNVKSWQATLYQSNEQGALIAVAQAFDGEYKAEYLKQLSTEMNLLRSDITVYSDSHLDLPILKMAGQAIGVKPDFHLKQICLQNGWEIL